MRRQIAARALQSLIVVILVTTISFFVIRAAPGDPFAYDGTNITPAIRALIRDDKVHQIYSMMQFGKKFGMQTMNDALYQLYMSKTVSFEDCARASHDPTELMRMCGMTPERCAQPRRYSQISTCPENVLDQFGLGAKENE